MTDKSADRISEEIENRISEMEKNSYVFPERFSRRDYIITAFVSAVCLAVIIAGAYIK